jgi:peptidoglycan L-alanyl-D-glutamate endopeptidase CwlK
MLLKLGKEGIEVANWQRFLLSQGYKTVEADGDFGPKTDHATKQWQLSVGLTADGIVGPDSLSKAQAAKVDVGSQKPAELQIKSERPNQDALAKIHPVLASKAGAIIYDIAVQEGFTLKVTQGLRTFAEQDKLFAQGRTLPGKKVTNARAGQSMHCYGLAVDFAFLVNGKISWDEKLYQNIGRWAEVVGLEWGGNFRTFKDYPHVQLKNLPSYKVLLPIYQQGGLKAVWEKYKG